MSLAAIGIPMQIAGSFINYRGQRAAGDAQRGVLDRALASERAEQARLLGFTDQTLAQMDPRLLLEQENAGAADAQATAEQNAVIARAFGMAPGSTPLVRAGNANQAAAVQEAANRAARIQALRRAFGMALDKRDSAQSELSLAQAGTRQRSGMRGRGVQRQLTEAGRVGRSQRQVGSLLSAGGSMLTGAGLWGAAGGGGADAAGTTDETPAGGWAVNRDPYAV